MSRTYRRLRGDQQWHNRILQRWEQDPEHGGNIRWPGEGWWSREKELARYHGDMGWSYSTPSHWIRQYMTKPQRQEVRKLIHKVHTLPIEDAGELMFPLAKKPHDYYW